MADDLEAVLRRIPATNKQRAELWDAYEGSADADELASRIETIGVPKQYKAQLWDMKSAVPSVAHVPEPGVMGGNSPALRAGMQVLAPKNPKAVLDLVTEAAAVNDQLPGAIASVYKDYATGAMKGLGSMGRSATDAIGLTAPDAYSKVAFEGENPVQSVGSGAAQTGATMLAAEAAGVLGAGNKILRPVVKALATPTGAGVATTAVSMAEGDSLGTAAEKGALVAGLGKTPALFRKIFPKVPSKLADEIVEKIESKALTAEEALEIGGLKEIPKNYESARAALKAKNMEAIYAKRADKGMDYAIPEAERAKYIKPIPPSKLKPVIDDSEAIAASNKAESEYFRKADKPKIDKGKQAKAEHEARQAAKRTESPQEPAIQDNPVLKQIDEAISPGAAFEQLKTHGIKGQKINASDARAMVDAVWMKKEPTYRSIEQFMKDRYRAKNARRTRSE